MDFRIIGSTLKPLSVLLNIALIMVATTGYGQLPNLATYNEVSEFKIFFESRYFWDAGLNNWNEYSQVNRTYDPDGHLIESDYSEPTEGGYVQTDLIRYQYSLGGNLLVRHAYFNLHQSSTVFQETNYEYDGDGRLIETTTLTSDIEQQGLLTTGIRFTYEYDEEGNRSAETRSILGPGSTEWVPERLIERKFEEGVKTREQINEWDGQLNDWTRLRVSWFTNDTQGNEIEERVEFLNPDTGQWEAWGSIFTTNTYNEKDQLTELVKRRLLVSTLTVEIFLRETYSYFNNQLVERKSYNRTPENTWNETRREDFVFDTSGNIVEYRDFFWSQGPPEITSAERIIYAYQEFEIDPDNEELIITPNPSTGQFKFFIRQPVPANSRFLVFNNRGMLMYSVDLGDDDWNGVIDLTHYDNGLYLLRLETPNYVSTRRIVVSR